MKELTIEAKTGNLEQVLFFVDAETEAKDCPMKAQVQINLAVEEIFVNIANYAYPDGSGSATIRVDVTDEPREVALTFIDSGIFYNPLEKEDPDVTLSAEEREIGGLGIFLTKKIMDDVSYEYTDGQNILTLKKRF